MWDNLLSKQFQWWWILGLLLVSIPVAAILLAIIRLVIKLTQTRALSGYIAEARIKHFLLRDLWLFCLIFAPLGAYMLWQRSYVAGILIGIGSIIIFIFHLPFSGSFPLAHDFFISFRLAEYLWLSRHEIQGADDDDSLFAYNEALEAKLTPDQKELKKKIENNFYYEQQLFDDNLYENSMLRNAAGYLQGISTRGVSVLTAEFIYLYFFSLSIICVTLGLYYVSITNLKWQTPLMLGIILGILGITTLIIKRWRDSDWNCIVCGKITRRRIKMGNDRPHVCSIKCEQTLSILLNSIS